MKADAQQRAADAYVDAYGAIIQGYIPLEKRFEKGIHKIDWISQASIVVQRINVFVGELLHADELFHEERCNLALVADADLAEIKAEVKVACTSIPSISWLEQTKTEVDRKPFMHIPRSVRRELDELADWLTEVGELNGAADADLEELLDIVEHRAKDFTVRYATSDEGSSDPYDQEQTIHAGVNLIVHVMTLLGWTNERIRKHKEVTDTPTMGEAFDRLLLNLREELLEDV